MSWLKELKKENEKQINTIFNEEIKALKKISKSKPVKETASQRKYREIMENPKISDKQKAHLKRNTKNGTVLDIEDLRAFEDNARFVYETDSDEEEPKSTKKETAEDLYKEIMNNPNIFKSSKKILERNYKKDKVLPSVDYLKKWLKNELIMAEDSDLNFDKPTKINVKKGNKAKNEESRKINAENKRLEEEFKKISKTSKKLKPYKDIGEIMRGHSELVNKKGKLSVDTELNVKKGLEPKVQRALKKSVDKELEKGFKGGSINLDYSSSEDENPKGNVNIRELKNYAKMLNHLLEHIEDPKEPIDYKDYRDAKGLIDNMKTVKRGRGRPRKNY